MIVESYEDVIVLSGALRSNFWETIHTAISLTLKRHPTGVIIDCSGITEANHDGIDTFRDAMDFIKSHDARIIVAAVPHHVMEVLKSVSEVRSQLPIAKSVDDARRSLDLLLEEGKKKKKSTSKEHSEHIVAVIAGDPSDKAGLALSAQIADSIDAMIHLVFVIIVPRDLPIQAPLMKEEEIAAAAIEKAKKFLVDQGVDCSALLERGREIASTLEEVLDEVHASQIVIPLSKDPVRAEDNARVVKAVSAKISKQVVFIRG